MPRIHAGGRPALAAASPPSWSVKTTAQAPSEDGQDSRKRTGSHIIGDASTFSMLMSCSFRWAYGFFSAFEPVLDRDHRTDLRRRTGAVHVGPHERGERAAGTEREAAARAEGELRVALGLLLVRDGQHALVPAGLDVVGRDDAGRAADGAGGVDAEHRLARGAERVGQVQLRLHDAFEEVGRLADDDRVDVRPVHLGVFERA